VTVCQSGRGVRVHAIGRPLQDGEGRSPGRVKEQDSAWGQRKRDKVNRRKATGESTKTPSVVVFPYSRGREVDQRVVAELD